MACVGVCACDRTPLTARPVFICTACDPINTQNLLIQSIVRKPLKMSSAKNMLATEAATQRCFANTLRKNPCRFSFLIKLLAQVNSLWILRKSPEQFLLQNICEQLLLKNMSSQTTFFRKTSVKFSNLFFKNQIYPNVQTGESDKKLSKDIVCTSTDIYYKLLFT